MGVSDEQVAEFINTWGVPLDRICLVSGNGGRQGSILLWRPTMGGKYVIIENVSLDTACYGYLLRQGAKVFASEREAQMLAHREKWTGWNK